MDIHRLNSRILDVRNAFQNTNIPFNEIVCVIPPPYNLDWFERSYLNVILNRYECPFFLRLMNGIQGGKQVGRQWNRLLDSVVTITTYKKIIIDHVTYIKVFYDGTVSYLAVSTDDVLNTTNNETSFTELRIVFEQNFDMKFQYGSVLKYLNLLIFQSPLGFSVDNTDHIIELVN